jgi:apolipoprotein N-acyltransferase
MKPLRWVHRLRSSRRKLLTWLSRPGVIGPVTGGLLLLAFPPLEWTPVAWAVLAPLLWLLEREGTPTRRRGVSAWFGAGWGLGLVLYAGHYHWMFHALVELAGVSLLHFLPFWLAMVAGFALGPALALSACAWARGRLGWALWWTAPLAFMAVDALLLTFPFGGMPWGSWAATQPHTLAAAWIAPVLGGPGIVAVLVAVNAGWAALLDSPGRGRRARMAGLAAALLAATLAVLTWPNLSQPDAPPEGRTLRAVLVPSNLPVPAPGEGPTRLRHYLGRTLAVLGPGRQSPRAAGTARTAGPRLVVWPESASATDLSRGKTLVELHDVATLIDGDLLLGSDTRELGRDYNSLYLVQGGAFDFQRYDKRELVPFGEYVPALFRPLFGRKATAGDEDYTAGDRPPVLTWRGRWLGVAICFESTLPGHVAGAVRHGAQVLVVIANDAWLTPEARTYHLRLTALRALEAGRDALFVSNGGWTAHLSRGQVMRAAAAQGNPLAVEALLETGQTPWVRWGYALPLLLASLALLVRLAGHGVALMGRQRSSRLPMG